MSQEAGLLADIIDHPGDDGLRLIYADWLEDNGRCEHADFIRLDLAKERGEALPDPERERRRQLYQEHHADWSRAIDRLVRRRVYRRGLIESVYLTGDQYFVHAGELHRLAPVREVSFCTPVDLPRIATLASLARVERIEVACREVKMASVRHLLDSPQLGRLRCLCLPKVRFARHELAHLLSRPLAGVSELTLGWSWNVQICHVLANSPLLAGLRSLSLRSCYVRDADATTLARSPYLAELQRLDVRGNWLTERGRALLRERFGDRVILA